MKQITLTCAYCGHPFQTIPSAATRPRPCCSRSCAYAIKRVNPEQRFWQKVCRGSNGECWPWLAGIDKDGYGIFAITHRKSVKAHRFVYTLTYGEVPSSLCILHTCDHPSCCNPGHLIGGTNESNIEDRVKKGRSAHGERIGCSKLRESDIINIRSMHHNGWSQTSIGRLFNVHQSTISSIIRRTTWKHV